jgi:hypothetical protein
MKTDPTAGIAGIAGTPLSHQAIESGNGAAANRNLKTKHSTAISDTLETSDRDADGRLDNQSAAKNSPQSEPANPPELENGDRLDLQA